MKNLIEYLKDKIYYVMGATVFIIILLIVISSCSGNTGNSYSAMELRVKNAAITYYNSKQDRLPKDEKTSVQVSIGTLIDAGLLKEKHIKDPKNKEQLCSGYVQVKKVDDSYAYIPFLTCKGNYEPKFLKDVIKKSKLDEYGNGVYQMDGEYVYRGDDVNNYVSFNNQTWRIIKVDKEGDIEIIYFEDKNYDMYTYDTDYNSEAEDYYGITTDYLQTDIRKSLIAFYDSNFSDDSKAKIVPKNICIGSKLLDDKEDASQECSKVKENEKIGLLRVSDYPRASLDPNCTRYDVAECTNRNYFSASRINTWLLTPVADTSYEVYILNGAINTKKAYYAAKIYPTIYLTSDSIVLSGDGSVDDPYILK